MPGRTFNSTSYRYGMNGKEKDDEIKGSGNSYNFEARQYDPRLGRWLSIDPLARQFPFETPYNFAGNNPIYYIDKDGEKKTTYITTIENGKKTTVAVVNKDYVIEKRESYIPDEGGHVLSIDWDYNVVEFITIDVDNNKAYTTGEQITDKAWDDGIAWLDDAGATKQSGQAGGNSLVARGFDLPGNASKYEPTADNPGEDIDISDLMGGRGGASLKGKVGQVVEVLKTGFEAGQALGEIVNTAKKAASSSTHCKACAQGGGNANFIKDSRGNLTRETTDTPATDTTEYH